MIAQGGDDFKLKEERFGFDVRKKFFTQSVPKFKVPQGCPEKGFHDFRRYIFFCRTNNLTITWCSWSFHCQLRGAELLKCCIFCRDEFVCSHSMCWKWSRTGQTKAADGSEVAPRISGWNVLAAWLLLNLPVSFCCVWILGCWSFAFASWGAPQPLLHHSFWLVPSWWLLWIFHTPRLAHANCFTSTLLPLPPGKCNFWSLWKQQQLSAQWKLKWIKPLGTKSPHLSWSTLRPDISHQYKAPTQKKNLFLWAKPLPQTSPCLNVSP